MAVPDDGGPSRGAAVSPRGGGGGNRVVERARRGETGGDERSSADGGSRSASGRADEWGGEAHKVGHAGAAFLGNAVKAPGGARLGALHVHTTGAEPLHTFLISRHHRLTPPLNAARL